MTNRETNTANAGIATVTSTVGSTDLSFTVDSTASLPASPCYLVIDPDDDAKREVVYFDGTFTGTSIVTSVIGNRYLDGGSGITHDIGAKVIHASGLSQMWTDINDRVDNADTNIATNVSDISANAIAIAANNTAIAANTPIGGWIMFGGATAPPKWKLLNGQALSRTTYSALFAVFNTTYGAGDGVTTFNVPDLRQRFPMGKAASGTGSTLGGTGGTIDHTHTGAAHNHGLAAHTHAVDPPNTTSTSAGSHTHGNTGGEVAGDGGGPSAGAAGSGHYHTTGSAGAHTHDTNIPSFTSGTSGFQNTDLNAANSTGTGNPPFLAMNFIVYTGV